MRWTTTGVVVFMSDFSHTLSLEIVDHLIALDRKTDPERKAPARASLVVMRLNL